jgi:hypothetical protein
VAIDGVRTVSPEAAVWIALSSSGGLDGPQDVRLALVRGQHEDLGWVGQSGELPGDLRPVDAAAEVEIHQHDVRPLLARDVQCDGTRRRFAHQLDGRVAGQGGA